MTDSTANFGSRLKLVSDFLLLETLFCFSLVIPRFKFGISPSRANRSLQSLFVSSSSAVLVFYKPRSKQELLIIGLELNFGFTFVLHIFYLQATLLTGIKCLSRDSLHATPPPLQTEKETNLMCFDFCPPVMRMVALSRIIQIWLLTVSADECSPASAAECMALHSMCRAACTAGRRAMAETIVLAMHQRDERSKIHYQLQ